MPDLGSGVSRRAGSSPVIRTTSERTLLRSDFCLHKNRSHAPSFLLFREKSRSVRLFVCKRTHDGSLSLPTFHDIVRFTHMKTLDFTVFLRKSCKNTRTNSEQALLVPSFFAKNQSHAAPHSFFTKRFACIFTHRGSQTLPPFGQLVSHKHEILQKRTERLIAFSPLNSFSYIRNAVFL